MVQKLLAGVALAFVAILPQSQAHADSCSPVPADNSGYCDPTIGNCIAQSGGQDIDPGGTTLWPQTASSTISVFNPSPVYLGVSVWVMLDQQSSPGRPYAQIGYEHRNHLSYNDVVFAQWTDNNGGSITTKLFETLAGGGSDRFIVNRFPNTGRFQVEDAQTSYDLPTSVTWGPDTTDYRSEMDTYYNGQGDHVMGNASSPVSFTGTQWTDQHGRSYAEYLSYFAAKGDYDRAGTAKFMNLYNWDSSQFEVWDSRCW
ncbi:MAG: hypothetical protein ACRDFX_08640 [Chloroflexota bacterium]